MIYMFTRRGVVLEGSFKLFQKNLTLKEKFKSFNGLLTSFSENSLNLSNKNFPTQRLFNQLSNLCLIPGAIFEQGTDEVQSAFKFAMLNHNLNVTGRRFELQAFVDLISTADAFKLSRLSEYTPKALTFEQNFFNIGSEKYFFHHF